MSIEIKDDDNTMAIEIAQTPEEPTEEIPSNITVNQKVGDRTCATYNFKGEDHTLGNLLRYSLIKNPDVEFCGYSITHPSESELNLRLQTTGKRLGFIWAFFEVCEVSVDWFLGKGTNRVMKKGFKVIKKLLDIAENKFAAELERFEAATA